MRLNQIAAIAVTVAGLTLAQPINAQEARNEPVSRQELRELLLNLTTLLNRSESNSEAVALLRYRLDSLDAQQFEYLYRFSGNWSNLRTAVALMSEGQAARSRGVADRAARAAGPWEPLGASPAGLPADLFSTAYPTGSNYDTFRATLPGLGAMSDTPGSVPGLNDERCDANFEAGVAIASATFAFANIIAETVCEALPELADIPCWIAQGVLQVAAEANNTVASQCAIVDGAVDAAEIEAGYENTVAIYKNLDAHHLALGTHDTDVKMAIANATLALTTLINNHDTQVKALLNTHDTDVKALFVQVLAGIAETGQQLKVVQALNAQVIRLLLTPEGRRTVNPAVFTCTGDDCPKILDCPGRECQFPLNPPLP